MKPTSSKVINIAQKADVKSLSRGQKLFNKLIKQIEQRRAELLAWQAHTVPYQQLYGSQFLPELAILNQHRAELMFLFDRACDNKVFTKSERSKLAFLITSIGEGILSTTGPHDPAIKEILDRYTDGEFSDQETQMKDEIREMLAETFGTEVDDEFDLNDPTSLLKMMEAQMRKLQAEGGEPEPPIVARKKNAKQLAKEAKLAEEEKNVSQSIREVYRKLASALHPDREPDLTERARKTALMQRVNVAYDNKDLLQLLELQLELEHIDQSMIDGLSEDRLKHYNKVLTEQLGELELELDQMGLMFSIKFQLAEAPRSPQYLIPELERDIVELKQMAAHAKNDLHAFEDPKALKAHLKRHVKLAPRQPSMDEMLSFGDLEDLFREEFNSPRKR